MDGWTTVVNPFTNQLPKPVEEYHSEYYFNPAIDFEKSKDAVVCFESSISPNVVNEIYGPGGTGKTYLHNTLITVLNVIIQLKTVAVAWTGIAANLLKKGATVHRAFE
ncbi:hypothetical protein JTB14_014141 [Gonioctena quinquepunctata]|nr:hypothetical protein JTB14_014141 [Gonioctena quinquepunctata]